MCELLFRPPPPQAIVAPNVVAIVGAATAATQLPFLDTSETRPRHVLGAATAAKLVGAAGGMSKLAELPSTVVQILGSKKRALAGMPRARSTVAGERSVAPAPRGWWPRFDPLLLSADRASTHRSRMLYNLSWEAEPSYIGSRAAHKIFTYH